MGLFVPYLTSWDLYCQKCRNENTRPLDEKDFWDYLANRKTGSSMDYLEVYAEKLWQDTGRPYYNVHPFLIEKLSRVDLSKIPSHLVETPHEFPVVSIRFPQDCVDGVSTFLFMKVNHNQIADAPTPQSGYLILLLPKGERTGIITVAWRDNEQTLDWSINHLDLEQGDEVCSKEDQEAKNKFHETASCVAGNCCRIAATIGFLANSKDELIEPDVLSKDRFKFDTANNYEREAIVNRAHRRGKIGWNVGNDLMFLGATEGRATKKQEATGRELNYAHIRGGHPHAVRYGTNHNSVKIMWFRPTMVRSDLPFDPRK